MKIYKAIKFRILELCNERGITPNKMCTNAGVIQSTVNKIFYGHSKNPKIETLYHLCVGLGITLEDFFACEYLRVFDE